MNIKNEIRTIILENEADGIRLTAKEIKEIKAELIEEMKQFKNKKGK